MSNGGGGSVLPTVVIAYGDDGRHWLSDLRGSLIGEPSVRALIDAQLLQFWAWGVDPEAHEADGVDCLSDSTPAVDARLMLDRGRGADLRAKFDPDLKSVLILERWSPIETDIVGRTNLLNAMDLGSRANCLAGQPNLFDYQWVGLVDAVRGPDSLSLESHAAVSSHFKTMTSECANLFVDREDCELGALTTGHADRALGATAMALISANAGGARVLQRLVDELAHQKRDAQQLVVPVSVTKFRHGLAEYRQVLAEVITHRLSLGHLPFLSPPAADLASIYREHLKEVRTGPVSLDSVNHRAREAAARFLTWFIASVGRNSEAGARQLSELKRAMRASPGDRSELPAYVGEQRKDPWWLRFLRRVFPFLFRRDELAEPSERIEGGDTEEDADILAEVKAEWDLVVASLERAMTHWRTCVLGSGRRSNTTADIWKAEDGAWTIVQPLLEGRHSMPLSEEELGRLARISLQPPTDPDLMTDLVGMVVEQAAVEEAHLAGDELRGEAVEAAFHSTRAEFHARMVSPLMANTGTPLHESKVLWFCAEAVVPASVIEELDESSNSRSVRVVRTTDPGRSLRLGLASPIRWTDVVSLQPPRERPS